MVDLQPILTKTLKQDSSSVKHRQVVYKKKCVCKERKETTHERKCENHTSSYIYIYRKKNTMYVKMVTRPRYMK